MIIIDQNIAKLQVVSSVADLHWTVSWQSPSTCPDNENQGLTIIGSSGLVQGPAQIEYISVYNATGSPSDITIQIDKSGTPRTLLKIILLSGYTLTYNEDSGWQVLDITGSSAPAVITGPFYGVTTGTDTYTTTIAGVGAYFDGLSLTIKFVNANSGVATLNVNGLGDVSLVKFGNAPLSGTPQPDIKAGQILDMTYNGTNFQIKSVTCNIPDAV